jgi:hypothetical protein
VHPLPCLLERLADPFQPVVQRRVFGHSLDELRLCQSSGQVLESFVVQVTGQPVSLGHPDLPKRLLHLHTLYCRSQHVGYGPQEIDVVFCKGPTALGVRSQNTERLLSIQDDDAYAAHHSMIVQQRRCAEALLLAKVLEYDRLSGE